MTIEKEDVFSVKKQFHESCAAVNFTKSRLARISLDHLVVYKSGWTQENPSQSYLIDIIWYNMIWYGTLWYDMISHWFTIVKTIRLKLFLSWNEHARRILQNIHCFGFENMKLGISFAPSFLDQCRGYFEEGYLVVIAILWECYSIFHLPLLYLSVTIIIPPTEPFPHFPTKSHIHIALYLWLLKTIVSTKSHLLLWSYALALLSPVNFEEENVLKVQLLNSLLCNPFLYAM